MTLSEEKYITNSEIKNSHTILRLRKDGIIELSCNENHTYEIEDILENHKAIQSLSPTKKSLALSLVGKYTSISKSTREFMAKGPHKDFICAEAFVLRSLAHILLAKFYIKLNKPIVKTAYFQKEEEAVKWLLKQK